MADERPCIYVIAGTNGAGKSSIAGTALLLAGASYFNPDEAAKRILAANPGIGNYAANSAAWHEGKRLLKRAIAEHCNFAFETTLGGNTITALLERALSAGLRVRIWYVGLNTVELHIKRVRARVERGGHDIPEPTIRRRFDSSRLNLIRLLPKVTELRMYDNSQEGDPETGHFPEPTFLLHVVHGTIVHQCALADIPDWAKPVVAAARHAK